MLALGSLFLVLITAVDGVPLKGSIYGKHFEGDIAISNPDKFTRTGILRAFVKNKELRWSKTIQYTIGPDLAKYSDTIRECLDWISERSCLTFVQGNTGDHIKFTSFGDNHNDGNGCWSYFGRRGGEQAVNLEIPGCISKDIIYHEIFHALGKVHEQSRPDRDEHVEILLENVQDGEEHQFEIKKNVVTADTGYDIDSIMHYDPTAFSKNGEPTIKAKYGDQQFGDTEEPTETDLWELNHAYGCKTSEIEDSSSETEDSTSETEDYEPEGPVYYYLSDYYEEYPNAYNDYEISFHADNDTQEYSFDEDYGSTIFVITES